MADERSRPPFPGADTSLAAVFALLFGLIPFVPGAGLVAIVFGALGLRAARTGRPGKGMAVAGIVLGAIGTLMCCGPIAIVASLVRSAASTQESMAIYEIDVSTKAERLLVDLPGLDTNPAYLADGASIVFEHAEPGQTRFLSGEIDLYVLRVDGTPSKLTSLPGGEHSPSVFGATGEIAFAHKAPDGTAMIGRIMPDATAPTLVEASKTAEHLLDAEWFPSGEGFAVTRNQRLGAALRLWTFSLDTEAYERVTATEGLGDTSETSPVWTPDGLFFAFKREILLIKPDDAGQLHTVLEDIRVADMLYRNGQHFVVVSGPGKPKEGIYSATLRNGKLDLTPFLLLDDGIGSLDISPDASRVVMARRKE